MDAAEQNWARYSKSICVSILIGPPVAIHLGLLAYPWVCVLLALCPAAIAATALAVLFHSSLDMRTLAIILGQQAGSLIIFFAFIYFGYGLVPPGSQNIKANIDFLDATYFSVITWTTLGYGDFQPPQGIRLVSAIQAILGYLYLGLFVALIADIIADKHPKSRPPTARQN